MDSNENQKQINRIAKTIKLDEYGNPINTEIKKEVTLTNQPSINKPDSSFAIFIVTILIIIALTTAFICYVILPKYINIPYYKYNDITREETEEYVYNNFYINNRQQLNKEGNYFVNNDFNIRLVATGLKYNVLVNEQKLCTVDYVSPLVAIIDDLLILFTHNAEEYSTVLFAVDKEGNKVYELYNINNKDGMRISNNSSFNFNTVSLILNASRISGNQIFITNNQKIAICNQESMDENNINSEYIIASTYSLKYKGNHEFDDLLSIKNTTLGEYKSSRHLCQ